MTVFERYLPLLSDSSVGYDTVAACGLLIAADARMNGLLMRAKAVENRGVLPRGAWVEQVDHLMGVLQEFDAAWREYHASRPLTAREPDRVLLAATEKAERQIQGLIDAFPARAELGD